MAYEFKLPDLGEGLTEGEIARWLVSEGDEITEDAPLVEIQTDKTTVEIPSPAAGVVARILVAEGVVVPVGTVLVVIGDENGSVAPFDAQGGVAVQPPHTTPSEPVERLQATPLVRRVAQEFGVDLATLTPTGPAGRVTEADVRAAAGARVDSTSTSTQSAEGRRDQVRGVRRQIVEHLTRAHREVPAVTFVEECDFADVDLALLLPTVLQATAKTLQ